MPDTVIQNGEEVYEVVTGHIRLGKQDLFMQLHKELLSPMMHKAGISPLLLLFVDIGSYHKFVDIYRYDSWQEYKIKTDKLIALIAKSNYYGEIAKCIEGGIKIELAHTFPRFSGRRQRE